MKRKHFGKCTFPGCENYPRHGTKYRCEEHHAWGGPVIGPSRPPKPDTCYEWCEPCGAWVIDLLHSPVSANS